MVWIVAGVRQHLKGSAMTDKKVLSRFEAIAEYFGGVQTRFDDARRAKHLKVFYRGRKVFVTREACEACIAYQQRMSDKGKPCVYRPSVRA